MFRKYLIRKNPECNHWLIFIFVFHSDGFFTVNQIAHLESFSDVLIFWNAPEVINV